MLFLINNIVGSAVMICVVQPQRIDAKWVFFESILDNSINLCLDIISLQASNRMNKLTFQQLNILCDLNIDRKHVEECIQVLKNEDCIFESGIVMPRNHISSIYNLRFSIAKESGNFSKDFLADYQECIIQLDKSKAGFLGITSIHGDNKSFLIFYEPDAKKILGILKLKSEFNIKNLEEKQSTP